MVDIEQDVSPETDAVTEVLDDVSERLYTALPRWFQEHAQLNMEVDGVDITILVNQSWNSGYMAYTMIIRSLNDEEKTHTDAIYSWWQSGPQKRTSGTYSVTVAPKGETGGVNTPFNSVRTDSFSDLCIHEKGDIEQTQAESIREGVDLYFKGVRLAEEEKAKTNLFSQRTFGGYVIDITDGAHSHDYAIKRLSEVASGRQDEAALFLSLSNEEIRRRLERMGNPRFSINDQELNEIRTLILDQLEAKPEDYQI